MVVGRILGIFFIILIGFGVNKIGWLPTEAGRYLSRVVLNIAAPCVVVSVMGSQNLAEDGLRNIALLLIVGAVQYAVVTALSFPLARALRPPAEDRGIYRNFLTFTNNGFMGLPVTLAIFGQIGMFYMAVLNALFNVLIFTLGIWNVKQGVRIKAKAAATPDPVPRPPATLRDKLKEVINPVIIGLLIGFFLLLTGLHLPQPVTDVLDSLGSMMAPLSMIVIGVQLTESRLTDVIRNGRLIAMSLIRLIGIGALSFAALAPLYHSGHIPPLLAGIITLNVLLPCAAVPVMFAEEYGGNVKTAAEGTFLSTLFSIVTIPIAGVLLSML